MAEIKKQELSDEELEDVSGGNIFDFFNDLFRNKVTNNNGGTTSVNVHSIHLNMKNALSLDIANMVNNKLFEKTALPVCILEDKNWI